MTNPQTTELARMTAVKEAYRYYVDASDMELKKAGITREDALRIARELDDGVNDG